MSTNPILSDRDVNASLNGDTKENKPEPKSLEYHRQMLQSKLDDDQSKHQYISPSDGIMSPCTAKLSAYRNKHFMKAKPQSLFGKATSNGASAYNRTGMFESAGGSAKESDPESRRDGSITTSKESSPRSQDS